MNTEFLLGFASGKAASGGGGGGNDIIVTLTLNDQTDTWEPDCTFAELYAAYQAGKTIAWVTADGYGYAGGYYSSYDNGFVYYVMEYFDDSDSTGEGYVEHGARLDSNGVTDYGRDTPLYYTGLADAVPSDVANGKVFFNGDGQQTGTASGGGGASNVVIGTFKGTGSISTAMDITLSYTGSGFPIAVMIFPSTTDISTFNNLIMQYAVRDYVMDKLDRTTPSYNGSGDNNSGVVSIKYKTSSATSYGHNGTTSSNTYLYDNTASEGSVQKIVRIRSATKMSVFIAGGSYGFAPNIEYTYCVIYSE